MIELLVALAWAGVISWLLERAIRQSRAYERLLPSEICPDPPLLAVIIPARDEAARIGRCLAGLLAQSYPADRLALVVVDDHSRDGTAAIVHHLAGGDERVRLLTAEPLPEGWAGKPWACWLGARAARQAEWFCFIDADVVPQPSLLATALAEARRRSLDMMSLEPFQELGTIGERLLLPVGFLLLAVTQDIGRVNDSTRSAAAANGQFILIRRTVYEATGGHGAVAGEVSEDSALARRVKRAGYRLALLGGERLLACRMYCGFAALWNGLAKNTTDAVGGVGIAVAAAGIGIVLTFAAPIIPLWITATALASGTDGREWLAAALAIAASLALLGSHIAAARHFRIPTVYALIFPMAYLLGSILLLDSARRRLSRRVAWKGRVYALCPRSGQIDGASLATDQRGRRNG